MNKHKKVTCEKVSAVIIRKPIYDKREFMVSFYITLTKYPYLVNFNEKVTIICDLINL